MFDFWELNRMQIVINLKVMPAGNNALIVIKSLDGTLTRGHDTK